MKKLFLVLGSIMSLLLIVFGTTYGASEEDEVWNSILGELESSSESSVSSVSSSSSSVSSEEDVSIEILTNEMEEISETSVSSSSSSSVAIAGLTGLPNPTYSIKKEGKVSYLLVDWNIDKTKYQPIVLVSKDGKTFTSGLSANGKIKLDSPGRYGLLFQVKNNGSYETVYRNIIDNDNINTSIVGSVKTGPMNIIYFIIAVLGFGIYGVYRNRKLANK